MFLDKRHRVRNAVKLILLKRDCKKCQKSKELKILRQLYLEKKQKTCEKKFQLFEIF